MSLSTIKLLRDKIGTWSIYLMAMGWQGEWHIFGVHSQCKSGTFLVDRNGKHGIGLRTSRVEAAYVGRVCVVLILKAWQVSKGPPNCQNVIVLWLESLY
jgi:hypothetical protein